MKREIIFIIILVLLFFLISSVSFAQAPVATGTPSVYKVTLKRFRISSDNGATWTTVKEGTVEFDIASVDAGATVGNFFAGSIIPGTYNRIEHTISATFKMEGYIIDAVGTTDYYTSTTAANGTNSMENFDINNPPADYGEASITVFGYNEGEDLPAGAEAVNIVVEKGVARKVNINFDVTNTLNLYNMGGGVFRLMPGEPTVTVSVE